VRDLLAGNNNNDTGNNGNGGSGSGSSRSPQRSPRKDFSSAGASSSSSSSSSSSGDDATASLKVRAADSSGESFEIVGLSHRTVRDVDDLLAVLRDGNRRKTFGQSHLNDRSSRSHTVCRLVVTSGERMQHNSNGNDDTGDNSGNGNGIGAGVGDAGGGGGGNNGNALLSDRDLGRTAAGVVSSELNLVDLAGSEALSMEYGATQQSETKAIK
jgi:hypothetical protein